MNRGESRPSRIAALSHSSRSSSRQVLRSWVTSTATSSNGLHRAESAKVPVEDSQGVVSEVLQVVGADLCRRRCTRPPRLCRFHLNPQPPDP